MSLLSPSALIAFARQVAPLLGTHCRTQPDEEQDGAVRIVDDDGRALVLYQDARKPQRLYVAARLPRAAEVAGIVLKPVAVAVGSTPGHAAAHIRRRLLPAHAAALAEFSAAPAPPSPQSDQGPGLRLGDVAAPTALQQHAARALAAVTPPFSPHHGGWVIGERLNRRRPLLAAWWQISPADAEDKPSLTARSMAPFLADALRRASLHTTEPRSGDCVFFALPPALNGQRHVAEASRAYRGQWDVLDRHTGAKVCGSGNRERAERYAEQLNTAYLAQQHLRIASLELPGIQSGAHEQTRLRSVAMTLVRWGFIPYGLEGVDHADVPGFLVLSCPDQPGRVVVRRVLEPWGDARPTAAQGVWGAGRRFDRDLAAYARCLSGPGLRAVVAGEQVRVTFTAAPARTGRLGGVVPLGRQRSWRGDSRT